MTTIAKWSVEDYHLMIASGVFKNRSVELLEGEIIEMSPEGPFHSATNDNAAEYLRDCLRGMARIREAHPITLRSSEPEPDIAIVRLTKNNYSDRHPAPKDIYWVIEISNTTLEDDLGRKKKIYAKAKISEYWVFDLKSTEIIIFREPLGNDYQSKFTVNKGMISAIAFPDIEIEVSRLIPNQ